ncbi:hypothetical protein BD311DRAFT_759067 [Dichomitus squalens]|uniref:Uncharacterized protein n=1 Tax=Dichomitus squalens TaxID=114155 RepID=A0A4Q9MMF5_9APHY|nr:hypothetical protein BD311DRAFT_759067 [Dichomitus squalens]
MTSGVALASPDCPAPFTPSPQLAGRYTARTSRRVSGRRIEERTTVRPSGAPSQQDASQMPRSRWGSAAIWQTLRGPRSRELK